MVNVYQVRIEVAEPVRASECPTGFCIHHGKLSMRTREGALVNERGEAEFLVWPDVKVWPVKILGTKLAEVHR